ncbi:MAG: alanine racemase [Gammaproteobacteria bacterium]|nr:MAG: alanine racemase [Gammaproteobacteria bacterium]RLA35674.1 MAG: alanine racemase [Gammaproteobacteria bacterium]
MSFGARACINLGAIQQNFQLISKKAPGARVMAVIKANAYGHGLTDVAKSLPDADCLAVARLSEAIEIRQAGIDKPIALLGGVFSADEIDQVIDLQLQICVHSEEQITWLEKQGSANIVVWAKIDTGMNRLGFRPNIAAAVIARLRNCAAVGDVRLMTHLANADDRQDSTTKTQIESFRTLASNFAGKVSIANSAGVLGWSEELEIFADIREAGRLWIRPGLALYGISPFPGQCGADLGLNPAMQFEAHLIAIKQLGKGERVGYGGSWEAQQDTLLGVVSAGYGDGYSRHIESGTPVLINGRRVPVTGRISMDLCSVDLGTGATDQVGDTVVLWGDELPVEEIAEHAGTIPYELVCGITNREKSVIEG